MKVSNLIPMNLQLFASSEGIESSVNAEPVGNVEPQQTNNEPINNNPDSEPVQTNNVEPVEPQQETKPVQSAEENARYAAIRRDAEAKANAEAQKLIDAEYDRLYGAQYGIHSKADYDQYVAYMQRQQQVQQEAEKYNANPELMAYIKGLEDKVNYMENMTKEQQEAAEREAFQKDIKSQVTEVLETAKKDGVEITEEQLLNAAIDNGLVDMKKVYKLIKPEVDMETLKQNAIKEYIDKLKSGQVPVEASGASPAVVTETPKSFEDARKGAAAMLRASKIFN